MKVTKVLALVLVLVMALTLLTSCGTKKANDGPRTNVRISINSEPTSMHAGFASAVVSSYVGMQMFDSLITKNLVTGEYEPGLASSWEFEDDNTLVFKLREGVKFHNGEAVTAEDVVFSLKEIAASGYAITLTHFFDNFEIRDEHTVVCNMLYPYGPAIECFSQAALGIFPKAAYEADPAAFIRNPVGSGPYKFVEWKTGEKIVMTANENYWGGKPAIKDVEFIIYNNSATSAALALENGELDVVSTIASSDNKRLSKNEDIFFDETAGSTVTFIMFNVAEGSVFANEDLRLAVAYGIDKESVILGAVEGYGTKAITNVPSYCYGVDQGYEPPQYNVEKAKEYLAKAGYADGLDITIPCSSTDSYLIPLEIVQGQLAEIGINITIEKMDNNAWFEDVFRTAEYPFQMLTFSASVADIDYYYEMYVSDGKENFSSINIPEVDAAYKAARSAVDKEVRLAAILDTVKVLGDKAVIVPIYQTNKAVATSKNLQGVHATAEGIYAIADWSWAE